MTDMNDINQSQLSLFRGVHDTQPQAVTLDELVAMMRDDLSVRDLTEKHRYALSVGDKHGAKRYKDMMLSFGVAAVFEGGRRNTHIIRYTGLSLVDIDHIEPGDMERVVSLVRTDEHTLLAYTTMSGQGMRVLFRYEASPNPSQGGELGSAMSESPLLGRGKGETAFYRQVFLHGNEYYSNLLGIDYDGQCKNTNRISTIAHDDNLYYNPDAVPFVICPEEKQPVGRPRKQVDRLNMTVESCAPTVLRELEQRGVVYAPGTYNKYVSTACYEMNRLGVPEEQCRDWAVNRFADYDTPEVEAIVRSCYLQTEEHGTATLSRSKATNTWASIREIQDWLTAKEIRIRHNVVTRKREMETPSNNSQARLLNEPKGSADATDALASAMGRTQPSLQNNLPERPEGAPHRGGRREGASVATVARYESATCDEESFSSPEECALAPLDLSLQRSLACEHQRTEGVFEATELTDKHVNSLYRAFSLDTGKRLRISDLYIIIESDFYPEYHPMREYLESLPQWNGIDYIDQVASMVHVTGCAQEMHNRFFKKWLVAMVTAWLEPDKTNHEILTYIGAQGIYKSTFMYHLLPTELRAYFSTKNFAGRMTKDDRLELTEMALVSLEELDSLTSSELNQLKAVTTDPTVNERAAFARYKERRPHIASFCGTGNNPRFLTDLTDNRRWLPFLVTGIDSPWSHPLPYTGMYSQAYTLYRTGFRYWFDEEENAELKRHNRQFEEPCMEEELILTYLRRPEGDEPGEFLTATRIVELIGQYVRTRLSPKKVALCMNRLGFEQRRTHSARGWIAVTLNGDEIKAAQRMNVHRSRKDE